MNPFEGKTPAERNKLIAAIALGILALISLFLAFGPDLSGSGSTATAATPTPSPSATPSSRTRRDESMPSVAEQDFVYMTTPISYDPSHHGAPDPGRNIFAFYEPPVPTPYSPTPYVPVDIPTPTPTPVPPMLIAFVMPQNVYAGSKGFRLEVNGDKFTPETRIYFNQSEMPTRFVSEQKLTTDIPANFIAGEGPRQVIVQTPDGMRYSNSIMLNVQAPPKPTFKYIGLVARKHYNNDTAYFQETGKEIPTRARLNDVLAGRFRLVSISAEETIFEDTQLGFRHQLKLDRPAPSAAASGPIRGGSPYQPYTPNIPTNPNTRIPQGNIPGIPNVPRYQTPANADEVNNPGQVANPNTKDDQEGRVD